ncbi:MAG: hypothetical protein GXO73_10240, partial [Calditrichaeota bacterium]|nr:hypothetical protein [Calditrichota bacterium]
MRKWSVWFLLVVCLGVSSGLRAQETTVVAWEFGTEGDTEGWTALHSLAPLEVQAGALRTRITGSDPYMASRWGLSIPGDSAVVIVLRMRISGEQRDAEFFWTTDTQPHFKAGLEIGFTLIPDGRFHVYEIPIGRHQKWRGTITRLRLDPGPGIAPGQDPVPLEIDYIRVIQRGPMPRIVAFSPAVSWVAAGVEFPLRLRVKNFGAQALRQATATISLPSALSTSDPLTRALPELLPGATAALDWTVKAAAPGQDTVRVLLEAPGLSPLDTATVFVVHNSPSALPDEVPGEPRVVQLPDGTWLAECPQVRLAVQRADSSYGVLGVYVAEGDHWTRMGTLRLPQLAVRLADGTACRFEVPFSTGEQRTGSTVDTLVMHGTAKDAGGAVWDVEARFVVAEGQVFASYFYRTSVQAEVLNASGPALRLGDGSFGSEKTAAIFPGLEWLVDGEESSSTLDVHEPKNGRFYPNPYRVTAPFMSVSAEGWTVVYSWDPLQEWAPGQTLPNPEFASPNVLENLDGHLLGLVVPPVPGWRLENAPEAEQPYTLSAGKTIRLAATLEFIRNGNALAGMRRWIQKHGLPVLPVPSETEREALHTGLRCFMFHLWVPSAQGWHLVLDDPWGPRFDGNVAADAWLSTSFENSVALTTGTRNTLRRAAQSLVAKGSAGALGWDFPFRAGFLENAWRAQTSHATHIALAQRDDGGWDYTDDPTLKNMPGTTLGTCARRAYAVLKAARITGNPFLKHRGLKALEFMNQFQVPRGAQTWEVPLHAPDVLAAANAISAYVEGYHLTGREDYLARATYWAETSLPFLYLWQAPERPVMPFGSIPVFGATWYTGAWFGRVVQWNGLDLAYALSKLAESTGDTTWQHIAKGLVRFGMQLQDYTAQHYPENAGMYPDAFDMTTGEEAYHWDLSPELIQRNLLRFQGLDPDVATVIVPVPAGSVHVSAAWPLQVSVSDSSLAVSLQPVLADSGFMAVAGIAKPRQVSVAGHVLPEVGDPDSVREGWHYAPTGVLFVKVLAEPPTTEIRIVVAKAVPRSSEPNWDFNEREYLEGWIPNGFLRDVRVENGVVSCVSTSGDPYLEGPFGDWSAAKFDSVYIVMAVDKGTTGQLFWARTDEPYFSESKSIHFSLQTDGRLHRVGLALRGHAEWRGTILRLRLDPTNVADAHIRIDRIWLAGKATRVDGREGLPHNFALSPAYPNPFNPDTQFVLDVPRKARVRAVVYDVRGRQVSTILNRDLPPARYQIRWN